MKGIAVILIALAIIALFTFGPLITIWALNTLFGLHIASTFETWFAAVWLMAIFSSAKFSIKLK